MILHQPQEQEEGSTQQHTSIPIRDVGGKHKIPFIMSFSTDKVGFKPEYQQEFVDYLSCKEYNSIVDKFDAHLKYYKMLRRTGFWIVLFLFVLVPLLPIYGGVKKGVVDVPLIMVAFGLCILVFGTFLVYVKIKNRKCYAGMIELANQFNKEYSDRNFRIETENVILESGEKTNTPDIYICYPVNHVNVNLSSTATLQSNQQHQSKNSQVYSSINDDASDTTPLLQQK